jgi:hypothetical protein
MRRKEIPLKYLRSSRAILKFEKKERVVKRSKNRITYTQTRRLKFRFPFVLSIALEILQNYRVIQDSFNCTIFNTRFRTQKATLDQLREEYV